jgi:hypothetical protein
MFLAKTRVNLKMFGRQGHKKSSAGAQSFVGYVGMLFI